jgi:hypothetical protein
MLQNRRPTYNTDAGIFQWYRTSPVESDRLLKTFFIFLLSFVNKSEESKIVKILLERETFEYKLRVDGRR